MTIAHTISDFLIDCDIDYHVFPHGYNESAVGSVTLHAWQRRWSLQQ
jgi:hypothetical protein